MCVLFNPGPDAVQHPEYETLRYQYLLTQVEIAEHYRLDVPEPVTHLRG